MGPETSIIIFTGLIAVAIVLLVVKGGTKRKKSFPIDGGTNNTKNKQK